MLEEAKKRDHRKLGKELGLFMLRDEGPGFPFFLPKGMVLKTPAHRLLARGPQEVRLCGDLHPGHPQPQAVGALRPLGPLQGQHVHHRHRRRGLTPSSP